MGLYGVSDTVVVLVDMDNVCVGWSDGLNKELAKHGIPENPVSNHDFYRIEDNYAPEHHEKIMEILLEPGFYRHLPPMPGAIEGMKALAALDKVKVFICTAPELRYKEQLCWTEKAQWVEEHLGKEWLERLIITRDKTVVFGDILFDDKPNIKGLFAKVENGVVRGESWIQIVYDHSYNKSTPGVRATWADFPGFVASWRNKKADVIAQSMSPPEEDSHGL